jgi:predicted XRE-type DNA-binding protein
MPAPDAATINSLRRDVALQIARRLQRRSLSQLAAARELDVPQPTLSKIMNGRVDDLSLELLIRIAVRLRLPLVLQTGEVPAEAGAYLPVGFDPPQPNSGSKLADGARDSLNESFRRLTPEQRLDAFLEHNELVSELHAAGRAAERIRLQKSKRLR